MWHEEKESRKIPKILDILFQCNPQGQRTHIIYTYASCEYHRLPTKNIQLIQSITLITDALPVTPYSRMVSVVMVEGLSSPSWYARP